MSQTTANPGEGLTFEKVWAALMENREQMKDTDARLKETDRLVKETAARIKETDAQMKKTDSRMGELGNRFGELAEYLVAPSIAEKFNELGFHFRHISPGGHTIWDKNGKKIAQIDLLLENGESIIAVEIKAKPHLQDISHHEKRLEILKESRKDEKFTRKKIMGALAGAIFPDDVKAAALEAGFYVLEQTGDTMRIKEPEKSKLRVW
ncbi:MAG: hypothetical protein FWD78_00505 [Treponema sp.]|nr:hypothetical protein [Treponema sp.]